MSTVSMAGDLAHQPDTPTYPEGKQAIARGGEVEGEVEVEGEGEREKEPDKGRGKVTPFIENISEATMACLITMTQGGVLALGLSHWIIASQTGIVAGVITAVTVLFTRIRRRWLVALLLGVATAVVDFFVHPGMFGALATEAVVTGAGATLLSLLLGGFWDKYRAKQVNQNH